MTLPDLKITQSNLWHIWQGKAGPRMVSRNRCFYWCRSHSSSAEKKYLEQMMKHMMMIMIMTVMVKKVMVLAYLYDSQYD